MPTDEDLEEWLSGETLSFNWDNEVGDNSNVKPIVIRKVKSLGCICSKCGELYEYAEPNQEDGTFKCWGCRH